MLSKKITSIYGAAVSALLLCNCGATAPAQPEVNKSSRQGLTTANLLYDFETGNGNWYNNDGQSCAAGSCSTQWVGSGSGQPEVGPVFEGSGALKYHINGNGISAEVDVFNGVSDLGIAVGDFVNIAIWLPPGAKSGINGISAIVKDSNYSEDHSKTYVGTWALQEDAWTTISVQFGAGSVVPAKGIGLRFDLNGSFNNDLYIDSVYKQ